MDIHVTNPAFRKANEKPVRGKTVAIICPKHGFIAGGYCSICASKNKNRREGPNVSIFKPMVYEDICEAPLLITSKRQLREECKKHDVTACRLL